MEKRDIGEAKEAAREQLEEVIKDEFWAQFTLRIEEDEGKINMCSVGNAGWHELCTILNATMHKVIDVMNAGHQVVGLQVTKMEEKGKMRH